jgi:hypothetical protein
VGAAERIRKLGFRRWYERALIEGHAYLVTSFLGMILAVASIELIGERAGAAQTLMALIGGLIGTAVVLFGVRRYLRTIAFAESLGDHATCGQCRTYAAFNVLASGLPDSAPEADEPGSMWLKVKCRKCGHEWTL